MRCRLGEMLGREGRNRSGLRGIGGIYTGKARKGGNLSTTSAISVRFTLVG